MGALAAIRCYNAPMLEVRKAMARYDAERGLWVVVECPFCGRRDRHQHGAGDDPPAFLGHRVAHCGALDVGGYELVDAGEPYVPLKSTVSDDVLRRQIKKAAKMSGFGYRAWRAEYGNRTEPLTDEEIAARGDDVAVAAGW